MPDRDEVIAAIQAVMTEKRFYGFPVSAVADAVLALFAVSDDRPTRDDLERLSDAATQGPWFYEGWHRSPNEETYAIWDAEPETRWPIIRTRRTKPGWDDAAFIVALVNAFRAGELVAASPAGVPADTTEPLGNPNRWNGWCECRCHAVDPNEPDSGGTPWYHCRECNDAPNDAMHEPAPFVWTCGACGQKTSATHFAPDSLGITRHYPVAVTTDEPERCEHGWTRNHPIRVPAAREDWCPGPAVSLEEGKL